MLGSDGRPVDQARKIANPRSQDEAGPQLGHRLEPIHCAPRHQQP
jgi:hypothetical protein